MVTSVLQVIFYLTPVMWMPSLLPKRAGTFLLDLNPFYHMLEIARAPLLGQVPGTENWVVAASMAVLGWGLAILIFGRYKRRIAYWL